MKKSEIEQVIKNGENVWYPKNRTIKQIDLKNTHPIFNGYQIDIMIEDENGWHTEFYGIKDLYKTKAEAEHYLHHANVTRTETLPFLTWEEFKNKYKDVVFTDSKGVKYYLKKCVFWCPETNNVEYCISIKYGENYLTKIEYDYTEQDFYKAYDECVRLFRGKND